MVEGGQNLWTVECLRGRLLAERVASKTAKEDAEFMGNKLIELERQLRLEIDAKNKVESRLKFLLQKMESLKLSPILHLQRSFTATEGSSNSSTTFSDYELKQNHDSHSEEEMREAIQSTLTSQYLRNDKSEQSTSDSGHDTSSTDVDSYWGGTIISFSCTNGDSDQKESPNIEDSTSEEFTVNDLKKASTREENNRMEHVGSIPVFVQTRETPNSKFCKPHTNDHSASYCSKAC